MPYQAELNRLVREVRGVIISLDSDGDFSRGLHAAVSAEDRLNEAL